MQLIDLIKKRYSVRSYQDKPVEPEKLEKVLEAARFAPTAKNLQPFRFIVIENDIDKQHVMNAYPRKWASEVPIFIVVCVDHAQAWRRPDGKSYGDLDAAIAVDHMTLAAAELGLGTCWVGYFDAYMLSQALKLPEGIEPVVVLPIGYPKTEEVPERHLKRKSLDELVEYRR